MDEEKTPAYLDPKHLISILIERKWLIFISLLCSGIAGIAAILLIEKTYSASTVILVQAQRVPTEYVQSIVTVDIESRINSLSQEILSRTNLEKIINQFNLFSGARYSSLFMEDKVRMLRSHISVEVTRDSRGRGASAESFAIAFEGSNPQQVMNITNTLASFFIDENLKLRESQAIGTSKFLDEELESMRVRLEATEKTLQQYRQNFMGSLPEQLETNLRILERLQEELSERQESLRDAKARLMTLSNLQIAGYNTTAAENQGGSEETMSLEDMRTELERIQSRYTEKHPDIIRLKQMIAEAEKAAGATGAEKRDSPEMLEVRNELTVIGASIQQTRDQIAFYQDRVEATPKREQELYALQRDYENMQESYQSLLNRKLEAEIAVNMERKQKGEQFRVIDPARLPERPNSPNMTQLFFIALATGIGLAAGGIILLEYTTQKFRQPNQVDAFLNLPILAAVPIIEDSRQKRSRMLILMMAWLTGAITCTVYAFFAAVVFLGEGKLLEIFHRIQ